ncbi:hypothetical protein ACO1B2_07935 [Staphylococcus saprophyticus]|uniref:hypothetical protein n=1 Tax=Staphylococcus saprophyticus TaxID=29385 RepID=UPI003BF6A735
MAYEYESKLLDYASDSKTYEEYKAMSQELQEVYRKAKAFDEILNITQLQHEEEYAEDVISVIDKYKEDE